MELIATLLIFGLVFLLLMSWGCGARIVRGLGASNESAGGENSWRDPVCGMLAEASEELMALHEGRPYFFCSKNCRDRFRDKPEAFT